MDDPNMTMKEYIRLEEEKARRQGRTFNWQTTTYGMMEYCENKDDSFMNQETEYPAIVFDDTSDAALSWEPTISPLDNNKIDFKISFDESDDEDYMLIFDENEFSCKIIFVDILKTDSEILSSPSPKPTSGYIDDLDFFKDFENEFSAIAYNDLKSKSDPLIEPSLGRARRRMTWRQFILALGLHIEEEMAKAGLGAYWSGRIKGFISGFSELPLIDLHELERLNIYLRVGDTWSWVAPGPERQQAAAAGAPGAAEDAPAADDGAQAVLALVQAPQPLPLAPQHCNMS
nr:hypothetical protein [Tanacetum cinerariifolium]